MTETRARLERIVLETLEQHAFMFGEPTDTVGGEVDGRIRAGLSFSGGAQGRLSVLCPLSFAREMASNLLGFDDAASTDDHMIEDVLLEFVNVLAGRVLSELSVGGRSVEIGSPTMGEWSETSGGTELIDHQVSLDVDDCPVSVHLELLPS